MSDRESPFDSEPNVFDRESFDGQGDTNSEALDLDSVECEDAKVEVIEEMTKAVPSASRGKVHPTEGAVSLVVVPCSVECANNSQYYKFLMRDTQVPDWHASYNLEESTFGRGDANTESSSRLMVTVA